MGVNKSAKAASDGQRLLIVRMQPPPPELRGSPGSPGAAARERREGGARGRRRGEGEMQRVKARWTRHTGTLVRSTWLVEGAWEGRSLRGVVNERAEEKQCIRPQRQRNFIGNDEKKESKTGLSWVTQWRI